MNICIPKFSVKPHLNRLWGELCRTWIAPYIQHPAQVIPAVGIYNQFSNDQYIGKGLAESLFGQPLKGAGASWESKMWLINNEGETNPMTTSSTNSVDHDVLWNFEILIIGMFYTTVETGTPSKIDFDLFPQLQGGGTVIDKLDKTNGQIQPSAVGDTTPGDLVYKDLGDLTGSVVAPAGSTVTAVSDGGSGAGAGVPLILGVPHAINLGGLTVTNSVSAAL